MPEEKDATDKLLKEWRASAMNTIQTLRDFGYLMRLWQKYPPDQKEFFVMIEMMADAGLEGWLDEHPLGLDALVEKLKVE